MGGRGGSPSPSALGQAQKKAAAAAENNTGFDTGDQELNELLDVFYATPGYMIGKFNGVLVINYEPNPNLSRDKDDILTMRDLREGLAQRHGWGRTKQDREIVRLHRAGQIQLHPLNKRMSVTQAMRDAAFHMGGEEKDSILLNKARQYRRNR